MFNKKFAIRVSWKARLVLIEKMEDRVDVICWFTSGCTRIDASDFDQGTHRMVDADYNLDLFVFKSTAYLAYIT